MIELVILISELSTEEISNYETIKIAFKVLFIDYLIYIVYFSLKMQPK